MQKNSLLKARFNGICGSFTEPFDLGEGDASFTEEVEDGIELNQAEENRPDVALID